MMHILGVVWYAVELMAALLARLTGSSAKYEPVSRLHHISGCVGSKVLVQGGITKDFSENIRQHLTSVVEVFDPYSELWEQIQGDGPEPGTYVAASVSLHGDLFTFGGFFNGKFSNTLHRLDTKTWSWHRVSPQNADGAPMPKYFCGMISFRDGLGVFGGYAIPQGPTEPQSFLKDPRCTGGRGWTNEFTSTITQKVYKMSYPHKSTYNVAILCVSHHCYRSYNLYV